LRAAATGEPAKFLQLDNRRTAGGQKSSESLQIGRFRAGHRPCFPAGRFAVSPEIEGADLRVEK
jgi:hypothetical protein